MRPTGLSRPGQRNEDRRYGTTRWRRLSEYIRHRDPACYVNDCPEPVKAADHIDAATLDMPDSRFYDAANLRGSCRRHNTARGVAARLERELAGGVRPVPRRYSYGNVKPDARGETRESVRFLREHGEDDSPPANSLSLIRHSVVTADYSRRSPENGDA